MHPYTVTAETDWNPTETSQAPSLEAGRTPDYPTLIHSGTLSGTVTVHVRWTGDPNLKPDNVFVQIQSNSNSSWQVRTGSGSSQATNGLNSRDASSTSDATSGSSYQNGFNRVKISNTAGDISIPISVYAKGYASGSDSFGSAGVSVSAVITDKALFISSPAPTYHRELTTDSNGWTTGAAVLDGADALGNSYGNLGVTMTLQFGNWTYSYGISYDGQLLGAWGDDSEVFNDWTCDRPQRELSDDLVDEYHSMAINDDSGLLSTPLDASFAAGATVAQHVSWQATDSSDGIAEDTNYFMTLHPQLQMEEEYKSAFSGLLNNPNSGVDGLYSAVVADWYYNGSQMGTAWSVTIEKSETLENAWHLDGAANVSVDDILNLRLGASSDAKSTDTIRIGDHYGPYTIPSGSIGVLWLCAQGNVHFYNTSQWDGQGYAGDVRVNDVRGVVFGVAFTEHAGSDIGEPPK